MLVLLGVGLLLVLRGIRLLGRRIAALLLGLLLGGEAGLAGPARRLRLLGLLGILTRLSGPSGLLSRLLSRLPCRSRWPERSLLSGLSGLPGLVGLLTGLLTGLRVLLTARRRPLLGLRTRCPRRLLAGLLVLLVGRAVARTLSGLTGARAMVTGLTGLTRAAGRRVRHERAFQTCASRQTGALEISGSA